MNTKATQAYIQAKVGTTDQGQLLLMLYDGALNFLQQAREKMLAQDYAGKGILISKALDIIAELSSSLNMEKGGDLAVNLSNLYFLCMARLLEANLKMNVERLDSVCEILSGLRSAYAQVIDTPEAKKALAQIDQNRPADAATFRRAPLAATSASASSAGVSRAQAKAAYGKSASSFAAAATAPEPQESIPSATQVAQTRAFAEAMQNAQADMLAQPVMPQSTARRIPGAYAAKQ